MASIKVTSEELESVSASLATGRGEVEQTLQSLRAKVDALVTASWNGAASDAFNGLYVQWSTSASSLLESLDGISQMLKQSADAYQTNEENIAGQFRQ